MKKLFFTVFVFAFACSLQAQKSETSMSPILTDASQYVNLIEGEYGMEIVRMEFDIIQTKKQTIRTLSNSYEYGICAFGDFRISDIDIKVYKRSNNQWVLVKEDNDAQANAILMVKPTYTSEYMIEITAYKFYEGYSAGHYGLIVFHE